MSHEHRKARLSHLIAKDYGSQEKFVQRSGRAKGRVSQMVGENHPFGEAAGKRLALDIGLPEDWFDNTWPTPKEAHALGCRVDQPYPEKSPANPLSEADPVVVRRNYIVSSLARILEEFDDESKMDVAFARAINTIDSYKRSLTAPIKPPKDSVAPSPVESKPTPAKPKIRIPVHR